MYFIITLYYTCIVLWSFFEMVFLLSYRNIGQLFTTDRYTNGHYVLFSDSLYFCREVIDVIGTMTFLGALFVYSDNLQVSINDYACIV